MLFIGKLKSVSKIEQEQQRLKDDFQVYTEIEKSKKLKDYLALKEKVESAPFIAKKKEIEALRYKGSPEDKLIRRFSKLETNSKIKIYYKIHSSEEYKRYKKLLDNDLADHVNELKKYLVSDKYKTEKADFKRKQKDKSFSGSWESTEAGKKEKEYDQLINSADFIFFNQFSNSKEFKIFKSLEGSTLISDYENLKKEVSSEKFKERKAYLEDSQRYLKTDDYKALEKYNELKKDEGILLYFRYNETDSFKFFREWTLVLEENFSDKRNQWSYISPVAAKGPGQNFSIKDQLQCYNGNKNFEIENGIMTLETIEEKKEGLYWDENFGFVVKDFAYTSGLMHSNEFFKQEYGLFEIKLKASKIKGVISSVSLFDDEENESIRLVSLESKKATGGIVYTESGKPAMDKVNMKFKPAGYVIVAVEWSPEKVEWRVNERLVGTKSQNIPHEKMGLRIETEVIKPTSNLPHRLDIDWIRCYKKR